MIRAYPAVGLLIFVVLGIVGADLFRPAVELMMLSALIAAVAGAWLASREGYLAGFVLALSLGFFAAGHFAVRYYHYGPSHVESSLPERQDIRFFGQIDDWPVFKSWGTEIKIALDSVRIIDSIQTASGGVLIKLSDTTTALQYGDRVSFEGRLYRARRGSWPGGFDYGRYLNLRGVHGMVYLSNLNDVLVDRSRRSALYSSVDHLRSWITLTFHRHLTPDAAALASGFLIGETRNIPPEVYRWFRDSGTLHLLAVSGSNVALVILFFVFVLRPLGLPRRLRALILLAIIVVFALVCYAEPSVVRASIMAALVIVAGVIERRYDLNQIIAVTALAILLWDPGQLYSVGFQLSFVAAWGLIITVPRLDAIFKRYHRRVWYYWVVMPLLVTLTAQAFAAPLLAYYFNSVPVISPLANLVVVPMVSVSVVGSLALLVAAAIWATLAGWAGAVLDWLLQAVLNVVASFGDERIPTLEIHDLTPFWGLVTLGLVVLAAFALQSFRARRLLLMTTLAAVNVVLLRAGVESLGTSPCYQFCIFRAADGLAVVSRAGGRDSADLYLDGLHDMRYPIDERLLEPALRSLGVGRLSRMMIRQADYGALRDIVRLARRFDADSILVPASLRSSVIDVNRLGRLDWDESRLASVQWNGEVADSCSAGICLNRAGLFYRVAGLSLQVTDSIPAANGRNIDSLGLIVVSNSRSDWGAHHLDKFPPGEIKAVFGFCPVVPDADPHPGDEGPPHYSLGLSCGYLIGIYDDSSAAVRVCRLD